MDNYLGGIALPALTDVSIRIRTCSSNNVAFSTHFEIVLVKD